MEKIKKIIMSYYKEQSSLIHQSLDEWELKKKQVEDLATKLDILGGFVVAQAYALFDGSFWAILFFIPATLFCATLLLISFILKGYEK